MCHRDALVNRAEYRVPYLLYLTRPSRQLRVSSVLRGLGHDPEPAGREPVTGYPLGWGFAGQARRSLLLESPRWRLAPAQPAGDEALAHRLKGGAARLRSRLLSAVGWAAAAVCGAEWRDAGARGGEAAQQSLLASALDSGRDE